MYKHKTCIKNALLFFTCVGLYKIVNSECNCTGASEVTLCICNFIMLKLKITNSTSCASQMLNLLSSQSSVYRRQHYLMFPW